MISEFNFNNVFVVAVGVGPTGTGATQHDLAREAIN
jgi:hypothetical protein